MDFLSKIGQSVLDVGKKAVSAVKSAFTPSSTSGFQNTAGVFASTLPSSTQTTVPFTPIPTTTPIPSAPGYQTTLPQNQFQTPVPSASQYQTPYIPQTIPSGPGITYTPAGATPSTYSGPLVTESYLDTKSRPSTVIGQTDSYGRTSSSEAGSPYTVYTDTGSYTVTPKVGFSGLSGGEAGSSFSTLSAPATGTSGITGGGYPVSTGINPLGISSMGTIQKEEEKLAEERKRQATKQIQAAPAPSVSGIVSPFQQLNVQVPTGAIDMGNIEATRGLLAKLINTPEALTSSDVASLNQNIDQAFGIAKQLVESQSPTPQNPMVDTLEQNAFIEQSGDPFGARQLLDEYRAQNTNLSELQTSRLDLIKNIQALNQTYTPILDDIKNNPNLPKALAARRLEQVQSKQKQVLEGFLNQLELVNQSIDDQNETVNRAFNIAKFAVDQGQQAQQNNLSKLKLFIDSGAIGAFTDADIKKYANLTGVSADSLKAVRSSAKSPNQKIITETDAQGNVRGIDQSSGKVVWTLPGAGKTTTQPEIKEFQAAYATYANRIENSTPIIQNLASTITGYNPVTLQAYITAQDIAPILSNKKIPENVKSYTQASRDIINAILRKESGAVISDEEFKNARTQYLPMPGDSNSIVQQKLNNIKINLDNYKRAAGGAYVPVASTQPVASQAVSSGVLSQGRTSSGLTFTVTR